MRRSAYHEVYDVLEVHRRAVDGEVVVRRVLGVTALVAGHIAEVRLVVHVQLGTRLGLRGY